MLSTRCLFLCHRLKDVGQESKYRNSKRPQQTHLHAEQCRGYKLLRHELLPNPIHGSFPPLGHILPIGRNVAKSQDPGKLC